MSATNVYQRVCINRTRGGADRRYDRMRKVGELLGVAELLRICRDAHHDFCWDDRDGRRAGDLAIGHKGSHAQQSAETAIERRIAAAALAGERHKHCRAAFDRTRRWQYRGESLRREVTVHYLIARVLLIVDSHFQWHEDLISIGCVEAR